MEEWFDSYTGKPPQDTPEQALWREAGRRTEAKLVQVDAFARAVVESGGELPVDNLWISRLK
jgi:hypothetical protein